MNLSISALISAMPGAIAQGLIWGIMGIGVYITYKVLDIADLTVDGTMCTGGAVCIVMMLAGQPMWLCLLCSFLAGMLAGLITGLLHTAMGISAILAGILTQMALWTVNLQIMGTPNQAISLNNYDLLVSLRYITDGGYPFYQNPLFVVSLFIIAIIAALYWFFGTEMGCGIRAVGENLNMAKAQGINTNLYKVLGLMLSNGLVALSSALISQYQGFADINMGRGAIVIGLAAVVIGSVLASKWAKNFALKLFCVVLGAIIYYIVLQIVSWMRINPDYLKMLSAVIVALFLAVPYWKSRYAVRRKITKTTGGGGDA